MSATSRPDVPAFPFVVARGRSGTTLLRAMLDAHPRMAVPTESTFLVQLLSRRTRYERSEGFDVERFKEDLFDHYAFQRWDLEWREVVKTYDASPPTDCTSALRGVYESYARSHGKSRYGNQTPSYVLHVDLIASAFPEAVFVHVIRDGRNVALSYLDTDFGSTTLAQAALDWKKAVMAGRAAGRRLGPERYREVRYEDLIREPEPVLAGLCEFVGLEFDESMTRYFERADLIVPMLKKSGAHQNLYKAPTTGLRDWRDRLSSRDSAVFESLAGDLLGELGYQRATEADGPSVVLAVMWSRIDTQVRRTMHALRIRSRKLRKRLMRRSGRQPSQPNRGGIPS